MADESTFDYKKRMWDMHHQIAGLQSTVTTNKKTIKELKSALDGSILRDDLEKHDQVFLDRIAELEAENEDLRSGKATQKALRKERAKTEKALTKCESLSQQVLKVKSARDEQCRLKEKYQKKCHEKDEEIAQYKRENKDLKKENKKLNDTIDAQNRVIADYLSLIDAFRHSRTKNHADSSIPSSHDPLCAPRSKKTVSNSRTPSGKNPGKQPGTPGARRPSPSVEDQKDMVTVACGGDGTFDPNELDSDGNPVWVRVKVSSERCEIGCKLVQVWKKYVSYEYRNVKTGEIRVSPFPQTIKNEVNYSPEYKAMLLYLQESCNITPRKCVAFFGENLGEKSAPSVGMTASLPSQFSKKLDDYKRWKAERLLKLDGVHVDHTPVKMNGRQMQVLVIRHPKEGTLYIVCKSKGIDAMDQTMLRKYALTLVHDHATAFYHYGTGHQECLAHELRYLKDAEELDNRLTWPSKMHSLLQEMIHAVKESDTNTVTEEQYNAFRRRYEKIIALAESEYEKYPPTRYTKGGYNLAAKMKAFENEHLTFLLNPDVDPTNNEAESAARKVKVLQRRKGTWRKYDNIQYDCDIQMFLEDCRLRHLDPIKMMAYVIATEGKVPEELNRNVEENINEDSAPEQTSA